MDPRPGHPGGQAHREAEINLLKQVGQGKEGDGNPDIGKGRELSVLTEPLLTFDLAMPGRTLSSGCLSHRQA